MLNIMEKHTVIELHLQGKSIRSISSITGFHRNTISRYISSYKTKQNELLNVTDETAIAAIQSKIFDKPKRKNVPPIYRKYTKEIDKIIDELLGIDDERNALLPNNKLTITSTDIYEYIHKQGFDISKSSVFNYVREKRQTYQEAFIKQEYLLGHRVEFDFGEVKLLINGRAKKYYLAVFYAPASKYKRAYLYTSQGQEVFIDAHNRFFKEVGGVYTEVVYDNMRNVVTRFIGKNEKQLNENLIKLSLYYGFIINVTNTYSPNEKGGVENSVDYIRNKTFNINFRFDSYKDASTWLDTSCDELNSHSLIDQEKQSLLPLKPYFDNSDVVIRSVNKYSCISIEKVNYSVPDYLVGKTVNVKTYLDKVIINYNNTNVAVHSKPLNDDKYVIDIKHFVATLTRKPGAIKNSVALKQNKSLHHIFNHYYINKEKEFITIIAENSSLDLKQLEDVLIENVKQDNVVYRDSSMVSKCNEQLRLISATLLN